MEQLGGASTVIDHASGTPHRRRHPAGLALAVRLLQLSTCTELSRLFCSQPPAIFMPEVVASSRLILQMEEIYVGCVGEKATDYCISFFLACRRITCIVN
jgi:hypothetical protein